MSMNDWKHILQLYALTYGQGMNMPGYVRLPWWKESDAMDELRGLARQMAENL